MRKRRFLTLTVWMLILVMGLAAQPRPAGLSVDAKRYAELPLLPTYSGVKYNKIPLRTSLKPYCPVAGNQGDMGACVGWAVGYGAFTISQAVQAELTDKAEVTAMAHSAAFVYNQIKPVEGDCEQGAFVEDALALLLERGDCLEQTFNFQNRSCQAKPSSQAVQEALQYRILDYAAVFTPADAPKVKIAKACKVLAAKKPLIVGMQITVSFWEIRSGQTYWKPSDEDLPVGYHSMVLTGYDNVEKQFELLNSFGPAWGEAGFIKISYSDFARLCQYAYVLLLDPAEQGLLLARTGSASPAHQPEGDLLSGAFVFRRPAGYLTRADGQEVPFFEEVPTEYQAKDDLYTARQPFFEVGDAFQLVAREIPEGRYVYVFSKQQGETAKLHFPKPVGNQPTASFMLAQGVEIVIPSEETVLQLSAPGLDYLCILYSASKIVDFPARLASLNRADDFEAGVRAVFSDLLLPATAVDRDNQRMSFRALAGAQGQKAAVPIVLKIMAK